jgi:hypothetical protein
MTRRNQTTGESILPIADAGSSAGNTSKPPFSSTQATKSYSDAVAERSPSTSPDVVRKSSDNLSAREEAQDASFENRAGDEPSDDEGGSSPSSVLSSPEEENRNPWVKVTTRRSRSLDSLKRTNTKVKFLPKHVKDVRDPVLEAAEKNLTSEQRERVRKCRAAVRTRRGSNSSRGEGTSNAKGKGPDPQDWGNVHVDPKELDPEKQREMLEHYNLRKNQVDTDQDGSAVSEQQRISKKPQEKKSGPTPSSEPVSSGDENKKSRKRKTGSQKAKSRKERRKLARKMPRLTPRIGSHWLILELIALTD